jgi:hypothetical protein
MQHSGPKWVAPATAHVRAPNYPAWQEAVLGAHDIGAAHDWTLSDVEQRDRHGSGYSMSKAIRSSRRLDGAPAAG